MRKLDINSIVLPSSSCGQCLQSRCHLDSACPLNNISALLDQDGGVSRRSLQEVNPTAASKRCGCKVRQHSPPLFRHWVFGCGPAEARGSGGWATTTTVHNDVCFCWIFHSALSCAIFCRLQQLSFDRFVQSLIRCRTTPSKIYSHHECILPFL